MSEGRLVQRRVAGRGPVRSMNSRVTGRSHAAASAARWDTAIGSVGAALIVGLVTAVVAGRAMRRPIDRLPADRAALKVRDGAAILGASVLADSAMEHLRGGFYNPAMFAAPVTAAAVLSASVAEPDPRERTFAHGAHAAGAAVGATGLAFHLYDVGRRPGGASWQNFFYAAPIGAPGALLLAGLFGLASERIVAIEHLERHPRERLRIARLLAACSGLALLFESAEVALLHFRGAFHDPAMWLPVTVPPAAGLALLHHAARPSLHRDRLARLLTGTTGILGVVGTGFHVYGVGRHMGGWRNWRQNVLAGPPTPAPSSFWGLALIGLASLDLLAAEGLPR
ncbi:MAG: hypothetical protein KDE35_12610 [Geminicoccaceae bacterium]|nr:hypothetical protein [Geminicoccaceae bacterium]